MFSTDIYSAMCVIWFSKSLVDAQKNSFSEETFVIWFMGVVLREWLLVILPWPCGPRDKEVPFVTLLNANRKMPIATTEVCAPRILVMFSQ